MHWSFSSALILLLVSPEAVGLCQGRLTGSIWAHNLWKVGFQWIRHSAVNLAGYAEPVPEDRTVREKVGRKVRSERKDRVDVLCDKCCKGRDMTLG